MSTTITAISQLLDALGRVPFIVGVLTKGTLLVSDRRRPNAPARPRARRSTPSRLESLRRRCSCCRRRR